MSLRLKFDSHDQVVRSIGEPPGVLVWMRTEENPDPSFAVSSTWKPPTMIGTPQSAEALIAAQIAQAEALTEQSCERFTAAEIAEGISDHETWLMVWSLAGSTFLRAANELVPQADLQTTRTILDWLNELLGELVKVHDKLLEDE